MFTSHIERGVIRKAAHTAAVGMLALVLTMGLLPANALATTDSRGGFCAR